MNFLQTLLNTPEIRENGGQVLEFLGLPGDFFQLPNLFQPDDIRTYSGMSRTQKKSIEHKRQMSTQNPQVQQTPRKTVIAHYHMKSSDQSNINDALSKYNNFDSQNIMNSKISASKLMRMSGHEVKTNKNLLETNIKVRLSLKQQPEIELPINPSTRVVAALEDIAEMIDLTCAEDFRIYI